MAAFKPLLFQLLTLSFSLCMHCKREAIDIKKFTIGYRTIKSAIGACISIWIASLFQLQFFSSAGILTILCIQETKKKSIHAVYTRFVASIVGMIFSIISFELIGYHPITLGCMLLLFIPTLVSLKVTAGFISSVVIILHIYSTGNFSVNLVLNEFYLMVIGFGTGLAVNMYMKDSTKQLNQYLEKIEDLYRSIFSEFVKYLRNGDTNWDGREIIEAHELILEAKSVALKDVENHLLYKNNDYYYYFNMREKQLEIIERLVPKITTIPVMVQQAKLVADFLEQLSKHVHSGNTAEKFREKLNIVKNEFTKMPLPENHEKFIAMASLYQLIEEMDQYLIIKQSFKGIDKKR